MSVQRVLITEFMDERPLAKFGSDFAVTYAPEMVNDRAKTLVQVADCTAIIVRNRTQVNQELLDAAPNLRAVGRLGVGLDNIDMDACAAGGVVVLPAHGANALSVAEYVISTAMQLVRGAYASFDQMTAGQWPRAVLGKGGEINGRTLGLVGYGGIARLVAGKARALGMDVIAFDPLVKDADVPLLKFGEVLEKADVISLHVPLTDSTRDLIDAGALAVMKSSAVLINSSRGGVVDEPALIAALKSGGIAGAALDVFDSEPLVNGKGKAFADTPNLILTPHIAGVTAEGNVRVSELTVDNVLSALSALNAPK